jgi:hypothetical protein
MTKLLLHDYDHTLLYTPGLNAVYIEIFLVQRPFRERLSLAFNYLFGFKSKGHWDHYTLDPSHLSKLKEIVEHLENPQAEELLIY